MQDTLCRYTGGAGTGRSIALQPPLPSRVWYNITLHTIDRILLREATGQRVVVDPTEIYLLEAVDGATHVRGRSATPIVDVRELHEVAPLFEPFGFLRVHREFAVNLRRVALVRPRPTGRDWELKLEPPVNRIVPISRDSLNDVWQAFRTD